MVRETSIEAYNIIKSNGLLSDARFKVYESLCQLGSGTANEIYTNMGYKSKVVSANTHARLGELVKMRCVAEVNKRPCTISGKNAIVFQVTGDLPIELPKKITRTERLTNLIEELRDGCTRQFAISELEDILKNTKR